VLATLHTNSAAGAVTRLLDLGIEDYLVASVLLLTSAQRLVRRLCPACSVQVGATFEQQQMASALWAGAGANPPERLPQVVGCSACHGKGYAGRIPIFEAISLTESLKARITSNFDEVSFQAMAVRQGTRTLAQDGLEHVLGGRTSLEELLSVVGQDRA
jgi:general secretion pathway protein E